MTKDPLDNIRIAINDLDRELLKLLADRRDLVRQVAEVKTKHGIALRDKTRENQLLSKLIRLGREEQLDSHYILDIFHRVIDDSLQVQQAYLQERVTDVDFGDIKVAHLGDEGSYSYLASEKHFATSANTILHLSCDDFAETMATVVDG
ncbi:MAG: chorismate mutase, partial [Enterobacterales bacterium]|nr:chorismate mutase [Enterobacterales bacterium]